MNEQMMAALNALDARDEPFKAQLDQLGRSIGYGRAIQLLGQLWDDMLQAEYPGVSRHQENMFRRTDIELIEAGLPLARKLTYMPKRGPKTRSKITTLVPVEFEVPNVGRVISETFLFGRLDKAEASKSQASNQKGDAE